MQKHLLAPVFSIWLMAAASQTALAADQQLIFLSDQLRARTARLVWDTSGYFSDAANIVQLDQHARAMHDSAASLATTSAAEIADHGRIDKDLATLAHYRVAYSKELDVLELRLKEIWKDAFAGSFADEDVRLIRSRLGAIESWITLMDRYLHPSSSGGSVITPVVSALTIPSYVCPSPVPPILVVPPVLPWTGWACPDHAPTTPLPGDGATSPPGGGGGSPPGDGGASPPGGGGSDPPAAGGRFPSLPPGRLPGGIRFPRPIVPGIPGPRLPPGGIRLPPDILGGGAGGSGVGGAGVGGIGTGSGVSGIGGIPGVGGIGGRGTGGRGGAGGSGSGSSSSTFGLPGAALSPETRGRLIGGLFGTPPSGSGAGSTGSTAGRGSMSVLSPEIRGRILRDAVGSGSSTRTGIGTGTGAPTGTGRATGVTGTSGISGSGSIRIPGVRP